MNQTLKVIAAVALAAALATCAYLLGGIHQSRRLELTAFSKTVTDNVWVAKHIRNNNIDEALFILEANAVWFADVLRQESSSFLPSQSEIYGALNPNALVDTQAVLLTKKEAALKLQSDYAITYPEMNERLPDLRARKAQQRSEGIPP